MDESKGINPSDQGSAGLRGSATLDAAMAAQIANEVRTQIDRELAVVKEGAGIALKLVGTGAAFLVAIFTFFGFTTWHDIKEDTAKLIADRANALVESEDARTGIKPILNDLVNQAILGSAIIRLRTYPQSDFYLSNGDWNRLREWLKVESLGLQEFSDVLAVLNTQKSERRRADADGFLADMLNPSQGSPFRWMLKHPDKQLAILQNFRETDMGLSALALARSSDFREEMRIAAVRYVRATNYKEGFDQLLDLADKLDDGSLKTEALAAAATLRPTQKRMLSEIDMVIDKRNNERFFATVTALALAEALNKAHDPADSSPDAVSEKEILSASKKLLNFAVDHGIYFSYQFNSDSRRSPEFYLFTVGPNHSATGKSYSFDALSDLRPYWGLVEDAANAGDVSRLSLLMFSLGDFADGARVRPPPCVRLALSAGSTVWVKPISDIQKAMNTPPFSLTAKQANEIFLLADHGKMQGLLLAAWVQNKHRVNGYLQKLSGGGFGATLIESEDMIGSPGLESAQVGPDKPINFQ